MFDNLNSTPSGNPYAILNSVDFDDKAEDATTRNVTASVSLNHSQPIQTELDIFKSVEPEGFSRKQLKYADDLPQEVVECYLKKLEDPYARISILDDEDDVLINANRRTAVRQDKTTSLSSRSVLTSNELRKLLRTAFESYSPRFERTGKLPARRKEIIKSACALPADKRLKLYQDFEKYILNDLGNYEPMLNRESRDGDDELCEVFDALIKRNS